MRFNSTLTSRRAGVLLPGAHVLAWMAAACGGHPVVSKDRPWLHSSVVTSCDRKVAEFSPSYPAAVIERDKSCKEYASA